MNGQVPAPTLPVQHAGRDLVMPTGPAASAVSAVVVSADATRRMLVSGWLEGEGLTVRSFASAELALRAFTPSSGWRFVVSDLVLPDLDGWRLGELLGLPPPGPSHRSPLVLLADLPDQREADRLAEELGVASVLAMPLDADDRGPRAVRALLRGEPQADPARLVVLGGHHVMTPAAEADATASGWRCTRVNSVEEAERALADGTCGVLVADGGLLGDKRLGPLGLLARATGAPVIVVSRDVADAARRWAWVRDGATHCVAGPVVWSRVSSTVVRTRYLDTTRAWQRAVNERAREVAESEHRLKLNVYGAGLGTWDWHIPSGRVVCNERLALMIGYSLSDLDMSYERFKTLVHEDDWPDVSSGLEAHLAGEASSYDVECRLRHRDGRFIWVQATGRVTARDADGRPERMSGAHLDITARKGVEDDLRRFRTMFDEATFGAAISDLDGILEYVNDAFASMHGYAPRELIGCSLLIFHQPEQHARVLPLIGRLLDVGSFTDEELWHTRRDGSTFPTLMSGTLIRDRSGAPRWLASTSVDISRIKEAERALRESEDTYRRLLAGLPDVVLRFDHAMRYLFISENVAGSMDRPIAEVLGKNPRENGSDERTARFWEEVIGRVVDTGAPVETEFVHQTPEGDRTIEWRLLPETGEPPTILCIGRDVTAQRRAERDYETIFREMLNGFATHEIICDDDGRPIDYRYLAVNPAFERMTGLRAEAIVGRRVREVLPDVESHWIETYGQVALSGEPVSFTNFAAPLGRHFEVIAFRPAPLQFSCLFTDVTDRVKAAEERERLQAQLAQAQKMESVGRLAGGVAHDFNNMLNVILGHAELALEQLEGDDAVRADLAEIRKAAERSAGLTRQLLAFARRQAVSPRVVDLNQTVSGMLTMLGRLIGEDIRLTWTPATDVWPVYVDPSQVDQMLANLCVNARDAIAGVGDVRITTRNVVVDGTTIGSMPPGDYVALEVADSGVGMSKEAMAHLFEPFYTTKPLGRGTGLGLATVYGAVTQSGGHVAVESEVGRGTCFTIYLPRHDPSQGLADETPSASGETRRGHETVLVVEDEPAILALTSRMLRRLGYRVLEVADADEALRVAPRHDGAISLLVTDVVMPRMNGKELAGRLREDMPNLRCLYTSGYTADIIAHRGVVGGDVHFLEKPFTVEQLARAVRDAIDSAP